MLRASSQTSGDDVDLTGIVAGGALSRGARGGTPRKNAVETGIVGDKVLLAFVEAALDDDAQATAAARNAVIETLGEAAMIDAATVIAHFQRMVRIADGTGIPLDTSFAVQTADIREELGINDYGRAPQNSR